MSNPVKNSFFKAPDFFAALVFLAMLAILVSYNYWKASNGIGDTDTAFFLDVLQNTWRNGLPVTGAVRAFLNVYSLIEMNATEYCAHDFSYIADTNPANILLGHANIVVYPLSLAANFVGPEWVAAVMTALSFVSLPVLAYVFLRRHDISVAVCLLFCIALCLHPAWRISAAGWIYFDRIFMPFGLAFALILNHFFAEKALLSKSDILLVLVITFVGGLTHERGALIMLIVGIAHLLLYRQVPRRTVYVVLGLCFILAMYLIIYSVFQNNVDHAGVYKNLFNLDRFLENVFRPGLVKLLAFNSIFIVLAIIFQWRAGMIAILTLLPNIIVSIGGAEKDGWVTHYHSFYFPFVISAGAVGLVSFRNFMRTNQPNANRNFYCDIFMSCFLLLVGSCMAFLNPYGRTIDLKYAYAAEGLKTPLYDIYLTDKKFSSNAYEIARVDRLVSEIPRGATVTYMPPFNTWKLLNNQNPIQIFPVGIDYSDYLLLAFERDSAGKISFETVGVALDPEGHIKAKECVTERVWAAGYRRVFEIDHLMLLHR